MKASISRYASSETCSATVRYSSICRQKHLGAHKLTRELSAFPTLLHPNAGTPLTHFARRQILETARRLTGFQNSQLSSFGFLFRAEKNRARRHHDRRLMRFNLPGDSWI